MAFTFFRYNGESRMTTSAAMEKFDNGANKQIDVTARGLCLGSIATAVNKGALKDHNITHVLTMSGRIPPPHPDDFFYQIIDVVDKHYEDLKQHFSQCFDFIDQAKRPVEVLCVTIVVAYLMRTRGMSLFEALQHIRCIRLEACPNQGFLSQLEDIEKSLQGASKPH